MPKIIATADWQLTHLPEHEYRWDVFDLMHSISDEMYKEEVELWVLGDIVDRKDNLPNSFLRQLMAQFEMLSFAYRRIVLLAGNHDFRDKAGNSIVSILGYLGNQDFNRVSDTSKWKWRERQGRVEAVTFGRHIGEVYFIPSGCFHEDLDKGRIICCHETVPGVLADDMKLKLIGDSKLPRLLDDTPTVIAGDIHGHQAMRLENKSQTEWIYTGAPHHIRYGEDWTPGYLKLDLSDDRMRLEDWEHCEVPKEDRVEMITLHAKTLDSSFEDALRKYRNRKEVRARILADWPEGGPDPERVRSAYAYWECQLKQAGNAVLEQVIWQKPKGQAAEKVAKSILRSGGDEEIFDEFCRKEKISDSARELGHKIMGET